MGLAKINVRFTVDMQQFSTDMQGTIRRMQLLGTQMNAVGKGLTTYITAPLLLAGGAAVKFASDYQESVNKVDVAFGSASTSVKSFAKDSLESFGIAEGTALDMASTYGDMATSMGLTEGEAAKMSTSLVALAGDLASFKNVSIDVANTAINSIFTGETESFKKLGIVLTEVNFQQFALSKGIQKQYKDFSQAEKVQLRYAYVMNASKNSIGDFARTGGNAASQSRIFTESLKQLGQQFGTIILPFFTKAITYVNGIIKGFGDLSTETKTIIVVVAGLAAAVGPLMVGLGNIIGIIPKLIIQFNALKAAAIANPYMAAAVAIGILAAAIYSYVSSNKAAVAEVTTLNKVNNEANNLIEKQKAQLNLLVETAKNENLSKKERFEAIKKINEISPKYLGNITLEEINTQKTTNAIKQYNEALLKGAKAKAALNLLVSLSEKELAIEIQNEKAKRASNEALAGIKNKTSDNILLQQQQSRLYRDQSGLQAALIKGQKDKLSSEKNTLTEIYNANLKYIDLVDKEANALEGVKIGTDAIKSSVDALAPGTIAFYEAQISNLQKLQKEQATTNAAWLQYQNNIDVIQAKIDGLTNKKISLPKPLVDDSDSSIPEFGLQELKNQKAYYENLREMYAKNSDDYVAMTKKINDAEIKIKGIEGVAEVKEGFDVVKKSSEDFQAAQERLLSVGQAVGQGVADAFSGLSTRLVESFGLASTGFEGFIGGLVGTVTKLIAMMLASSISQSIAGASASGTATGPAAIFTTPAFIATAVGGVLAAFAAIPKFATGGIMGGSSYYGDKILARVNSGEMIANEKQQKSIYNAMNQGSNVNVQVGGIFQVKGQDLQLVLARNTNSRNRLGQ